MAISVVTCCMNRNDQLSDTIRQWQGRDWVDQIVIVDWSSAVPVAETLQGRLDERTVIVRAEGEDRWVLAYAYNLGVAHATGGSILKIDADCFIDDRVVRDCHPDETNFYAGNWRSGEAEGKTKSVNGQCFFTRGAFEAVNGYNELLRGWGYDDEDLYHRLHAKGVIRRDIPSDLFGLHDHSDDRRTAFSPAMNGRLAQQMLEQQPYAQQVKNIVVANEMPWGAWFRRAPYRLLDRSGAVTRVERRRDFEIQIPTSVNNTALLMAGRMVLHNLPIDTAVVSAADYPTVINLFEQWARAQDTTSAAA